MADRGASAGQYYTLWDLAAHERSVDAYLDYLQAPDWPRHHHYQRQAAVISEHTVLVHSLVNEIAIVRRAAEAEYALIDAGMPSEFDPVASPTASARVCD